MKLTQAFKMAFMAIFSSKMRSFLTMLGIIIGVASVALLISMVQGTTAQVTDSISGLGSNLLAVNIRTEKPTFINADDVIALSGKGGIGYVSPLVSTSKTVKAGRLSTTGSIEGANQYYAEIRSMEVARGRFLQAGDLSARAAVAVIGTDIASELFGTQDALGNNLKIDGASFTVIGLLAEQGTTVIGSNDTKVIIPYTTASRLLRQTSLRQFYVSASSPDQVFAAEETLNNYLMGELNDEDDFSVFNQTSLLDTITQVTDLLALLLGGIAGISLLVGGIGIMNIMLVSVTERTREIGIRKAIGAQRFDIIAQFLIEAVVLSLTGGLIGVAISVAGLRIASSFVGFTLTLTMPVALVALLFSIMVGLIFGIYPAAKASGLKPIDALRYE